MQRMEDRWYFTKEQLNNTPSVRCGYTVERELSSRQQAANFIQDMGQRLQVTQLCINTAIVYMHRFYMFHSFTQFHRTAISSTALFLAAKVEEQPRKLEHVIRVSYMCLHREQNQHLDTKSEQYLELAQDLVVNENVLLQTLGFDVAIDHPHTHVVQCCRLVKASKDLAQTSYFMASNSLHLTTMCLQYKPTLVACFCIHLAIKWSNWEIPESNEGRPWFWYVDNTVTQEALEMLTAEFLNIYDKCPSRLKKKIMAMSANQNPSLLQNYPGPPNLSDPDKKHKFDPTQPSTSGSQHQQRSAHVHASNVEDNKTREMQPGSSSAMRHPPPNYKKLPPGSQHPHHSHSHRDQKSHSGHQPLSSSSSHPPKKTISRPPENMFPPPIRITDYSRTGKADHQQQQQPSHPNAHYNKQHSNRQPPQSTNHPTYPALNQTKTDSNKMAYPPHHHNTSQQQQQHHHIHHHHHSSSGSSSNNNSSYKPKQYEVPSRSGDVSMPSYPPSVKQESTDQSHRYDSIDSLTSVKPEPLSSMKLEQQDNSRYENSSHSSVSSIVKNEQNHRYDNMYNSTTKLNQLELSHNYEKGGYPSNVNIKQENVDHNHRFSSNVEHHNAVKQSQVSLDHISQYENNYSGHKQQHHRHQSQPLHEHFNETEVKPNVSSSAYRKDPPSVNSIFSNPISKATSVSLQQQKPVAHSLHPPVTVPTSAVPAVSNHHRTIKAPSIFSPTKEPTSKPVTPPPVTIAQPLVFSPRAALNTQQGHNVATVMSQQSVVSSGKFKRKRTNSSSNEPESIPPSKRIEPDEGSLKLETGELNSSQQSVVSSGKFKRKRTNSSSNEPETIPPTKRIEPDEGSLKLETGELNSRPPSQHGVIPSMIAPHEGNYSVPNLASDIPSSQDVPVKAAPSATIPGNSIETVEVGATIEIAEVHDKKHREGREHKKKKKHREHKDRERHKHKEKHKSKDKSKDKERSRERDQAEFSRKDNNGSVQSEATLSGPHRSQTNSPVNTVPIERSSLKIKIPKEKLVQALPGLKVKFSKELLQGINQSIGKNGQDSSTNHRTTVKLSSSGSRHHDSSR